MHFKMHSSLCIPLSSLISNKKLKYCIKELIRTILLLNEFFLLDNLVGCTKIGDVWKILFFSHRVKKHVSRTYNKRTIDVSTELKYVCEPIDHLKLRIKISISKFHTHARTHIYSYTQVNLCQLNYVSIIVTYELLYV